MTSMISTLLGTMPRQQKVIKALSGSQPPNPHRYATN